MLFCTQIPPTMHNTSHLTLYLKTLYLAVIVGYKKPIKLLLPFISTRAPSTFALRVELVRLTFGTSAHCWEHLTLSTTGSKAALLRDYCSGEVREMWRRVLPTSVITSLEISYRSKLNMKNEAGLFWIKVESKS